LKKAETRLKERCLTDLRKLPNSWWVKIQQVVIRGTPDILGVKDGIFVAIELKSDKNDVHDSRFKLQEYNLNCIGAAGGLVFVAHPENWDEVLAKIASVTKKEHL